MEKKLFCCLGNKLVIFDTMSMKTTTVMGNISSGIYMTGIALQLNGSRILISNGTGQTD